MLANQLSVANPDDHLIAAGDVQFGAAGHAWTLCKVTAAHDCQRSAASGFGVQNVRL
jgi:hypothetical protein